jgi:hypothetical protein
MLNASTAARAEWWKTETINGEWHSGKMHAAWDQKASDHKRLQLERELAAARDNTGLKLRGDMDTAVDRPHCFTMTTAEAIKQTMTVRARTGFAARGVPSHTTLHTTYQREGHGEVPTDWANSTAFNPKENRSWKRESRSAPSDYVNPTDRETKYMEESRAHKELMRSQALLVDTAGYTYDPYKYDPQRTEHYRDSHPAREQALATTYTPKVLETYMTRLSAGLPFAPPALSEAVGSTVTPFPVTDTLPHPEELEKQASVADLRSPSAATSKPSSTSSLLGRSGSAHAMSTATALAASTILRKTNIVKQYEHQGAWKFCQAEGCDAWSCCMSIDRQSRGCTVKVINRDRWNYDGPTALGK